MTPASGSTASSERPFPCCRNRCCKKIYPPQAHQAQRQRREARRAPRRGDVLQLYINDEFFERPTEENAWLKIATPRLDIVYEDENILLADKSPVSCATVRANGAGTRSSRTFRPTCVRAANGTRRPKTPSPPRSATASTATPAASSSRRKKRRGAAHPER